MSTVCYCTDCVHARSTKHRLPFTGHNIFITGKFLDTPNIIINDRRDLVASPNRAAAKRLPHSVSDNLLSSARFCNRRSSAPRTPSKLLRRSGSIDPPDIILNERHSPAPSFSGLSDRSATQMLSHSLSDNLLSSARYSNRRSSSPRSPSTLLRRAGSIRNNRNLKDRHLASPNRSYADHQSERTAAHSLSATLTHGHSLSDNLLSQYSNRRSSSPRSPTTPLRRATIRTSRTLGSLSNVSLLGEVRSCEGDRVRNCEGDRVRNCEGDRVKNCEADRQPPPYLAPRSYSSHIVITPL